VSAGTYILPLVSVVIILFAGSVATLLKMMDHPIGHKTHVRPTPLVGGTAIFLPVLIFCVISLWDNPERSTFGILTLVVGGAFLLGYVDDRSGLSPPFRLWAKTLSVLATLLLFPAFIVHEFDFTFAAQPIDLNYLAIPFSLLVLVGLTSAVNMADGMNGLVCGLSLIWSVFFLFYTPPALVGLLVLLCLCLLVTLVFNLMGRLFLGNSGAYALGIMLGLLSAYIYNEGSERLAADVIVVWFIVPVVDCLRLMATRAIRHRRSPMAADRNHLHHRLLLIFPQWAALGLYWSLVAVPGALAIAAPEAAPKLLSLILVVYAGLMVASSRRALSRRRQEA